MYTLNLRFDGKKLSKTFSELGRAESNNSVSLPISMRCPHCGSMGTFVQSSSSGFHFRFYDRGIERVALLNFGVRLCPNVHCHKPVFVVDQGGSLVYSSPPESIDFNVENVPQNIVDSMNEALICHATGCYHASALMVRRTLEEICMDKKVAGKNLKDRIEGLSEQIVIPKALIDAMDQLRILGNDAAHVEARTYQSIGKSEVEIGIILCKELVKSTYQLDSLVEKLKSLGA